jgi:hypothetical protein
MVTDEHFQRAAQVGGAAYAGNKLQINEAANKKAVNCSLLQPTANACDTENGRTWNRLISFIFFRLWDLGRRSAGFSAEIPVLSPKNSLSCNAEQALPCVSLPLSPRPAGQVVAVDCPQRLRGIGAGSPLAEQTPDLLPLKGMRTETAQSSENGNNAPAGSAQAFVSEQRTVNPRRQALPNGQPLAEGKESTTENLRRGSATGRVESKTVSSLPSLSLTKKAATGKQEPR